MFMNTLSYLNLVGLILKVKLKLKLDSLLKVKQVFFLIEFQLYIHKQLCLIMNSNCVQNKIK